MNNNEKGASAIEYGVMSSLIAITIVTALSLTGHGVSNTFCKVDSLFTGADCASSQSVSSNNSNSGSQSGGTSSSSTSSSSSSTNSSSTTPSSSSSESDTSSSSSDSSSSATTSDSSSSATTLTPDEQTTASLMQKEMDVVSSITSSYNSDVASYDNMKAQMAQASSEGDWTTFNNIQNSQAFQQTKQNINNDMNNYNQAISTYSNEIADQKNSILNENGGNQSIANTEMTAAAASVNYTTPANSLPQVNW